MRTAFPHTVFGSLMIAAGLLTANATWAAQRSGREVVEVVCASCHAEGKDGAPKMGDLAAWTERAKNGFDKLAEHATTGTGKMPAHGGKSNLTDLEMSRAIAFMATGGRAADPSKPYAQVKTVNADSLVNNHCIKCHGAGVNGAPRMNNFADWKPRLANGMEELVQSAIVGHNKMPSRSGLPSLSDTDLRNAVSVMLIQSAAKKSK